MTIPADIKYQINADLAVVSEHMNRQYGGSVLHHAWSRYLENMAGLMKAADAVPASKIRGFIQASKVEKRLLK